MEDLYFQTERYWCKDFQSQIKLYSEAVFEKLSQNFNDLEREACEKEKNRLDQEDQELGNQQYQDLNPEYAYAARMDGLVDAYATYCQTWGEIKGIVFSSAVAGLYHLWEKQAIGFLKHVRKYEKPKIEKWNHIKTCIEKYGLSMEGLSCYRDLNELRLVANAIKHGEGDSWKDLEELNPRLFELPTATKEEYFSSQSSFLGPDLHIKKSDVDRYRDAAFDFWQFDHWKDWLKKAFQYYGC